jgi:hypothetical protein
MEYRYIKGNLFNGTVDLLTAMAATLGGTRKPANLNGGKTGVN